MHFCIAACYFHCVRTMPPVTRQAALWQQINYTPAKSQHEMVSTSFIEKKKKKISLLHALKSSINFS